MDSKLLLAINVLLLSSWLLMVGFSEGEKSLFDSIGNGGNMPPLNAGTDSNAIPCLQKLLPCKNYLKSTDSPPASCCVPLKEMIVKDVECLCKVFNNPAMLKSLNTTKDDALNLPKACGAIADISKCKNAPDSPANPSTAPTPNGSSEGGAMRIFQSLGFGFVACFVVLVLSELL